MAERNIDERVPARKRGGVPAHGSDSSAGARDFGGHSAVDRSAADGNLHARPARDRRSGTARTMGGIWIYGHDAERGAAVSGKAGDLLYHHRVSGEAAAIAGGRVECAVLSSQSVPPRPAVGQ